jgi:hypothetical protein
MTSGAARSERGSEGVARGWGGRAGWLLGRAEFGRGKGMGRRGPRGRKEREGVLGLGWPMREKGGRGKTGPAKGFWAASFPSSFPFPFPTLKPFKPFHLNSNRFEFKPNTNKTMHQHECTSKLTL